MQKPADILTYSESVYLVLKIFDLDFLVVKLIVLLPDGVQKVDNCFFLSFDHLLKITKVIIIIYSKMPFQLV